MRSRRGSLRLRVAGVVGVSMVAFLAVVAFGLHRFVHDRLFASAEREARAGLMNAGFRLSAGATPYDLMTVQPGETYVQVLANGQQAVLPPVGSVQGVQVLTTLPANESTDGGGDQTDAGGDGVSTGQSSFNAAVPLTDSGIVSQFVDIDDADVVVERTEIKGVPLLMAKLVRTDGAGNSVTLISAASLAETERTLATIRTTSWFAVPLLALALALLAWYLVGRALRPVERMRDEADRISHGTLHRRLSVAPGSVDELGRLARTMNAMLDRLERSQHRQRQFVSDASHELRSPLATARALLEVDSSAETHSAALLQVDRISSLVDDLLALARLDEIGPVDAEVDLDEVVLAAAADQRDQHHDRGIEIDLRGVGPARLIADPYSVRRLVSNLVDNACRHASSRVELAVRVEAGDGGGSRAVLLVDDDGPGIPPDQRARVFERFARLDEGRARDEGGVGIGLALVRSVALAHGGDVRIEDAPIGGARISVMVPMRPTRHPAAAEG